MGKCELITNLSLFLKKEMYINVIENRDVRKKVLHDIDLADTRLTGADIKL